jgi:UrcA family protein
MNYATTAALMAITVLSNAAFAGGHDDPRQVVVDYSDLNLANTTAVKVLYRRLSTAATTVCGELDRRLVARQVIWRQCYEQALSAAIVDVNEPGLSALHSRHARTTLAMSR